MNGKFFHLARNCIFMLLPLLAACATGQLSIQESTPQPSQQPVAPAAQAPLVIAANQNWQETYIFVHPGDQLVFMATGTWSHNPADPQFSNLYSPGGANAFDPRAILASAPLGSLVGRIGDTSPPFLIGEHLALTSEYRGKLWVSMNDKPDQFSDNTGFVSLVINLTPRAVDSGIRLTNTRDGYTLVYPSGYFVIITPTGICLTQNSNPAADACDILNIATLQVGDAEGRTADQLAEEMVLVDDPNLQFESHDMLVDGERAIWVSRVGGDGMATLVMIVHETHYYLWSFTSKYPVPDERILQEINQVEILYNTVINSFQFLD